MTEPVVRPYRSSDRAAVHGIGADTAFFGEPVEALLEDRRLFCDLFFSYYTDLEPEHAWVACSDGEVKGFLLGCVNGKRQLRGLAAVVIPRVLVRLLSGHYHLGRLTWSYAKALSGAFFRGEIPHSFRRWYPAHLHLNVAAPWRGLGLGSRLLEAYLNQLQAEGIPGVHLHTTSRNEAACRLYARLRFRLLDARRARLRVQRFTAMVENRCYGLSLGG